MLIKYVEKLTPELIGSFLSSGKWSKCIVILGSQYILYVVCMYVFY